MKPKKTLLSITSMLALLVSITFIACQKDGSIDNSTSADSEVISAKRSGGGGGSGNQAPSPRAGADQTITLPVSAVNFDGSSSSDPDGTIKTYAWTKDVGTGGTITSASSAKTSVTGLTAGNYRFRLTVTDNGGATASDTVHVTVKGTGGSTPPPTNQPPVVTVGAAQTITLPVSSVTLSGSATDPDGTVASYLWTKISGTGGVITNANTASTTVTGLTAGAYVFNLKATDNAGASSNKTVAVTVNTTTTNQPPVVTVGGSQTITLPISSVTLSGSATDPNGTIASYLWTKVSGNNAVIVTPNAASTSVTGLTAGSYVFNLKATDNGGASSNKTVAVTVNASSTTPPPTGGTGGYNTLVYSNGYDNSSSINSNQLGYGSISTSVVKTGTGSFKSVVNAGEAQISGGWRSEQQYPETYSQMGEEIAVEYDELFEALPATGLSVQWHGNVDGTSGETSLWVSGGKFMVQRNTCGTAGCPNTNQSGSLMSIQLQHWYHMRWEIKFSAGSDGYERLYIDGALYFSVTGKTSDGGGQYLKIGQNLFPSTPNVTSVMYFDNLNIWKK